MTCIGQDSNPRSVGQKPIVLSNTPWLLFGWWSKFQLFYVLIIYVYNQIDRDLDFAHFLYKFLNFEVVLTSEINYITCLYIKMYEKAHLVSDFRKKISPRLGLEPTKWDKKWVFVCQSFARRTARII